MNINFNNVIIIFLIIIPILVIILLLANYFLAKSTPDNEKLSTYESGFSAQLNQTRQGMTIAYFVMALLFILFDLEVLLLYPLTVCLTTIGAYGFYIGVIFFLVLTLGFVVELSYGVLDFTSYDTNISHSTSSSDLKTNNHNLNLNFKFKNN